MSDRGYRIVPYAAVTVNGIYLPHLDDGYGGDYAVLLPNGKAAMNDYGTRPHRYKTLKDAEDDIEVLRKYA